MKTIFTLLAAALLLVAPLSIDAQGIYQLWGTTSAGGKDDKGSFFSTKYDGTAQQMKTYFTSANSGRSWEGNQPVVYNGKFYSLLHYGGIDDGGIISEYDPVTNNYVTKANIYSLGTGESGYALVVAGNKLYGVTSSAGVANPSMLFAFDPANSSLTNVHEFTEATGTGVGHEPVLFNGKLYGITSHGGNNNEGVIYEFNPANNSYTVKHHFPADLSGSSRSGFTIYAGQLWGVVSGKIFSFDPATNVLSQKQDLAALDGGTVYGSMVVLNNRLYGVDAHGGPGGEGFIFEYNPANNVLNMELEFTPATVNNRFTLLSYNGLLYGAPFFGGAGGQGALFSYNPATNVYTNIKTFSNAAGGSGEGRVIMYNNKLYGWLLNGGYTAGVSSLFEYNPSNNQFSLKITLGGDELIRPQGELMYYKNKLYGAAASGGDLNGGGIYAFDLQAQTFEAKHAMALTSGQFGDQGGFLLHNDKFYGVTSLGGTNEVGTLFQYDPNSNQYTTLFNFGGSYGNHPYGRLVFFNGKMYGTCRTGSTSNKGSIFEFNPATNTVITKVAFDGTRGDGPYAGLTVHNGRLFGVAAQGGLTDDGTLFEYLPLPNALVKLADFKSDVTGSAPVSRLLAYDNKLWGVTQSSSLGAYTGVIYQFDLTTGVLSKKKELTALTGHLAMAGMTVSNNKFYGMTSIGGSDYQQGVLFEYDPATNNYQVKTEFNALNGKWARRTELAKLPAPTAHGSPGSCTNTQTININAANANEWIPFTDNQGRAVAEINANGNILGNTAVRVFVNGGNIRQNGNGIFYLDRNITITTANTPVTPVSVRLYIRKTEFESLKATAGSGIVAPNDLVIYKNTDFCSPTMNTAALPLTTLNQDWGFDYVYTTEVTSFSSFYFAKLAGPLPVKIISFTGKVEPNHNQLNWKASCTNDVDFVIERSTDGQHFDSIGIRKAAQMDCGNPFTFEEAAPAALTYYRIKMLEANAAASYSNIVVLERTANKTLQLTIMPNPVTGSEAKLQITSAAVQQLPLSIHDARGRILLQSTVKINAGINNIGLPLPAMSGGVYYLRYGNGQTVQLVKQ